MSAATVIDPRYVQFFDGGVDPDHDQLGGKCASLVTMTAAGMPLAARLCGNLRVV